MKHDLWVTALSDTRQQRDAFVIQAVLRHTHRFVGFERGLELQVVPGGQDVAERRLVCAEAALSGLGMWRKSFFIYTQSLDHNISWFLAKNVYQILID